MNKEELNKKKLITILKECKDEFDKLPVYNQNLLLDWIKKGFIKTKTICKNQHSSYGLKHIFSNDTDIYINNEMFKHAMFVCGFEIRDKFETNWHFNISLKSPVLKDGYKYEMKKDKYPVKIPFANNIVWLNTRERDSFPRFVDVIKKVALANYKNREVIDGYLIATKDDYYEAVSLYLNQNKKAKYMIYLKKEDDTNKEKKKE